MASERKILLIEENHKDRSAIVKSLEEWRLDVTTSYDGKDAERKLESFRFGLVMASHDAPGVDAIELLKNVKQLHEETQVLFMSKEASIETAVAAMKEGALDFLRKPLNHDHLRHLVFKVCGNGADTRIVAETPVSVQIITRDGKMEALLDMARQVADSRASILILGESGTGKELFARFIHENSSRKNGPFIAINCGALPETLLESELFGHEKGAFTGAVTRKPGKFELADQGTILLDELTEMQIHLQAKLLRVLQEREIDRVGGTHPVKVDTRVIATSNRDIKTAIEKGDFREDLYYRLNVVPIRIPPLRERPGDIPLLAEHFIEKYNRIDGRDVKNLTKDAEEKLMRLPFKGNVRELENVMERAILLSDGVSIKDKDILVEDHLTASEQGETEAGELPADMMSRPLKEVEKKLIFHTLDRTNGNRTHAAEMLGISVRTLRNKLNEYKEKMDTL